MRRGLANHVKNFQDRVTPGIVQRVAKLFAVKPKGAGIAAVKKPVAAANGNGAQAGTELDAHIAQPWQGDLDYAAMGGNAEDMVMTQ